MNYINTTIFVSKMNLFLLSLIRSECVRWYADKHIVKMILELAQLLYGVWGVVGDPSWRTYAPDGSYKTTHINHPIAKWMRQNTANYKFAASYAYPMLQEYTRRYGKIHGCQKHLHWLVVNMPPHLPNDILTQMPQAMPDEFKVRDGCGTMEDTVQAYRNYYVGFKVKEIQITYTNTEWPHWLPKQDPIQFKLYREQRKLHKEQEKLLKQDKRAAISDIPNATTQYPPKRSQIVQVIYLPKYLTLHIIT